MVMNRTYFNRLYEQYDNRFWINNPSGKECDLAISACAVNCTTNPQYCQKLLVSTAIPKILNRSVKQTIGNKTIKPIRVTTASFAGMYSNLFIESLQ